LTDDVDLETALRKVKREQRWRRESQRLAALAPHTNEPSDPAKVVALAYPERLARRRTAESRVYLLAGGTAVELPPGPGLDQREWLAIAVADRKPGEKHGRVRLAAAADLALATEIIGLSEKDEVSWDNDVVARRIQHLGAIVLAEKPLRN